MFRLLTSIILLICALNGISQVGAKAQQSTLLGTWVNSDFGFEMTLLLNADGSGEFDGERLTYTINGPTLAVNQFGAINNYTFVLAGNKLTLSGADIEQPITFTRSGSQPVPAAEVKKPESSNTMNNNLVGVWTSGNESIEFKPDGKCQYVGQSYPYKVNGNQLILTTAEGDVAFGYSLSGDHLTLSYGSSNVMYKKGGASTPLNSSNTSSGRIDQTIVGKWCYVDVSNIYGSSTSSSSTCITLNADGSYQYYGETSRSVNTPDFYGGTNSQSADQGTWYVQGDRIYYQSQTQGSGSYKLEKRNHPKNVNDPMIILDGTAYVTAFQKSPW